MLAIWNRRELVTVLTMQEQSDILSACGMRGWTTR